MEGLEKLAEIASKIAEIFGENEVTSIEAVLVVAMVLGKEQDNDNLPLPPQLAETVRDFVAAVYRRGS